MGRKLRHRSRHLMCCTFIYIQHVCHDRQTRKATTRAGVRPGYETDRWYAFCSIWSQEILRFNLKWIGKSFGKYKLSILNARSVSLRWWSTTVCFTTRLLSRQTSLSSLLPFATLVNAQLRCGSNENSRRPLISAEAISNFTTARRRAHNKQLCRGARRRWSVAPLSPFLSSLFPPSPFPDPLVLAANMCSLL